MRRLLAFGLLVGLLAAPVAAQVTTNAFVSPPKSVTTGITASTTQTQGQQPLVSNVNVVATVANAADVVTAPGARAGDELTIFNQGANTVQVFPASGDTLGAGTNLSIEIEPNESREWVAFDGTTWGTEAATGIIHAEMFDVDNTDAFVVTDGGSEEQLYHTNGLQAGDLSGWTFDAAQGLTSFPVASIANSPLQGGSQAQITTTGSHLLAAGDIVSLSNMSAGSNAGVHIVLAPVAATTFEITSADSTDATGTMDQAATLIADVGSAGQYFVAYSASGTAAANNDVFDFGIHVEATHQSSTNSQRKFAIGADIGAWSSVSIITIADGDHVSFTLNNDATSDGNITIRDFTLVLVRL